MSVAESHDEPTHFLSLWRGLIELPREPFVMARIAADIALRDGITVDDIRGASRKFTAQRHEFMARAFATNRLSLKQIARWLGDRHHTTILHGVRKHERRAP